jgi:hypothetical protein
MVAAAFQLLDFQLPDFQLVLYGYNAYTAQSATVPVQRP